MEISLNNTPHDTGLSPSVVDTGSRPSVVLVIVSVPKRSEKIKNPFLSLCEGSDPGD